MDETWTKTVLSDANAGENASPPSELASSTRRPAPATGNQVWPRSCETYTAGPIVPSSPVGSRRKPTHSPMRPDVTAGENASASQPSGPSAGVADLARRAAPRALPEPARGDR